MYISDLLCSLSRFRAALEPRRQRSSKEPKKKKGSRFRTFIAGTVVAGYLFGKENNDAKPSGSSSRASRG